MNLTQLTAHFAQAGGDLRVEFHLVSYPTEGGDNYAHGAAGVPGLRNVETPVGGNFPQTPDLLGSTSTSKEYLRLGLEGARETWKTMARGTMYVLYTTWSAPIDDHLCHVYNTTTGERTVAVRDSEASTIMADVIEQKFMPGPQNQPRIPHGKLSVDFGGDEDIYTEGYKIPQKERVVVNQRKTELMAAILAYSKGCYSPLALSTSEERDMYPYHGPLQGFQRGLIADLAPWTVKYHRLSASPLATKDIERLRVEKHIYDQHTYETGFTVTISQLSSYFTTITSEQIIAVQDSITRAGQSGY